MPVLPAERASLAGGAHRTKIPNRSHLAGDHKLGDAAQGIDGHGRRQDLQLADGAIDPAPSGWDTAARISDRSAASDWLNSRINGNVGFCFSTSVPSDLPVWASSPSTSSKSSTIWKAMPS
jgi:hypothetical protein